MTVALADSVQMHRRARAATMTAPFSGALALSGRGRAARRTSRGFTMMEMMAVVAFIGVLAAGATPSMVNLSRERRVDFAANVVADLYRTARARAMGRGSATVVRWNSASAIPNVPGAAGHFTMREAVLGPTGVAATLPAMSCSATNWSDAGLTSKFVSAFDERPNHFKPAEASFLNATGTGEAYFEVCFTPRGRSFYRTASVNAFLPMDGVVRAQMKNTLSGSVRQVVIPPSGAARVVTEL
ncbi:MAG: prepilin-type N-terminal cleavage/methylation domain-containing protein [Myxococcales bacterium]|nr:prepilin-type N-terminal cleavage/methylation domain-containing protein [Myxococcales bacterium]